MLTQISTPGQQYNKTSYYDLTIAPALGLSANFDIVSLYLEPSLGFKVTGGGAAENVKDKANLGWGAYAEIYITPLKNLEWYFEADVSSGDTVAKQPPVKFAASTGITWYLPAL